MNKHIKYALRRKNHLYKKYISGGQKMDDETILNEATTSVSDLISSSKDTYFKRMTHKLNDPHTCPKAYWSILKRFLNKFKIPEILPLIVDNIFVTNFKSKATIFNEYFSNQCNTIENGSVIPSLHYRTPNRFKDINFTHSDISNIIIGLESKQITWT